MPFPPRLENRYGPLGPSRVQIPPPPLSSCRSGLTGDQRRHSLDSPPRRRHVELDVVVTGIFVEIDDQLARQEQRARDSSILRRQRIDRHCKGRILGRVDVSKFGSLRRVGQRQRERRLSL